MAQRTRAFQVLVLLSAVVFVGCYLFFVRTGPGQVIDDEAYLGHAVEKGSTIRRLREILGIIEPITVVAMLVAIVLIGAVRRILVTASISAAAMVIAIVAAEVFKRILPRPELAAEYDALIGKTDSYPSGHVTIATTFALALLVVTAPRLRRAALVGALVIVSVIGSAVVLAGWHRPSDVVGGLSLSLAVMSLAMLISIPLMGIEASDTPPALPGWVVASITGLVCLAVLASLRGFYGEDDVDVLAGFATVNLIVIAMSLQWWARALTHIDWTGALVPERVREPVP